jgi:hypothetical protein
VKARVVAITWGGRGRALGRVDVGISVVVVVVVLGFGDWTRACSVGCECVDVNDDDSLFRERERGEEAGVWTGDVGNKAEK